MASLDSQKVLDFHAPEDIQERVRALLEEQRVEELSAMEVVITKSCISRYISETLRLEIA